MNRHLVTLAAAVALATGLLAACQPDDLPDAAAAVVDALTPTAPPAPPPDLRVPAGRYAYPDATDADGLVYSTIGGPDNAIPAAHVIVFCVTDAAGNRTTQFLEHVFACSDATPDFSEVCTIVPPTERRFYLLNPAAYCGTT